MQLTHNYWFFQEAISPENCQKIIDLGVSELDRLNSIGENTDGVTAGNTEKGSMPKAKPANELLRSQHDNPDNYYIRDSKVAWLNDKWLYDLITPFINEANLQANWKWNWDFCESFQFTVYKPEGFYNWHTDGGSDHNSKYQRYIYGISPPMQKNGALPKGYVRNSNLVGKTRKISMTLNLNVPGEYEGGNLKFDFGPNSLKEDRIKECVEIRPQGSMIVFPSFLHHCVTPVTKGTRYSLVLWCVGEPWK